MRKLLLLSALIVFLTGSVVSASLSTEIEDPSTSKWYESDFNVSVNDSYSGSYKIDIHLLADTSGSMDLEWNTLENKKSDIVNRIESKTGSDVEIKTWGLNNTWPQGGDHEDWCGDFQMSSTSCSDYTPAMDDVVNINEYVEWLDTKVGMDLTLSNYEWDNDPSPDQDVMSHAEVWGGGYLHLLEHATWRSDTERVFVTISDADANSYQVYDYECGDPYADDLANNLSKRFSDGDYHVFSMLESPECSPDIEQQLKTIGKLYDYSNSDELADSIVNSVSNVSALECSYRVSGDSGSSWTNWQDRTCNSTAEITVGDQPSDICSNPGADTCWVEVNVTNSTDHVRTALKKFNIRGDLETNITSPGNNTWHKGDFKAVVEDSGTNLQACGYRVSQDGGSSWTNWQKRTCPDGNVSVTVGEGPSNICDTSVSNECWIQVNVTHVSGDTDNQTKRFYVGKCHPDAVGCWPMDDGGNQYVNDSTDYDNDGVRGKNKGVPDDPDWLTSTDCIFDSCLRFKEGNNGGANPEGGEFVTVDSDPLLNLDNFTIMGWVYPTTYAGGDPNIVMGKHEVYKIAIREKSDPNAGTLIGSVYDQAGNALGTDGSGWESSGESVPLNAWSHVAMTWNGSTFEFYVNGKLAERNMVTNAQANDNSIELGIGARDPLGQDAGPEYFFDGRIDELQLINGSKNVSKIVDIERFCIPGLYVNAHEMKEKSGRLKNDKEICRSVKGNTRWYDQDFGDLDGDGVQDTCLVNTLYGERGVRWFNSTYIKKYPHTVTEGIDDDWPEGASPSEGLESKPDQDSWNFNSETPVDTGYNKSLVYSLGFCGGDDASEYLTVQRCSTSFCSTNTEIKGVSSSSGSCIIEGSSYPVGHDERRIYDQGENVTFDFGDKKETVACFGGKWYEKWPVVLERNSAEVASGQRTTFSFRVINVEPVERTFLVQLEDTEMRKFSTIVNHGSEFEVSVPGRSSKSFQIEIYGADERIDSKPVRIQAESLGSDVSGEDEMEVDIVENPGGQGASREVSGIGAVQILVLVLLSVSVFALKN